MAWAEDNQHITEVKSPRLIETGYQSPQLKLWTLGPDEWLLFLKLPDDAARKKPQRKPDGIQLPLLDPDENQRQQVSSGVTLILALLEVVNKAKSGQVLR